MYTNTYTFFNSVIRQRIQRVVMSPISLFKYVVCKYTYYNTLPSFPHLFIDRSNKIYVTESRRKLYVTCYTFLNRHSELVSVL